MSLLFRILLVSFCGVGILHANITGRIIDGFGRVVNTITDAVGFGLAKVFDYNTDYNITVIVNTFARGLGLTANYVFNNNSGVVVSEKVLFYCINSKSKKLQEIKLNDPDIDSKILKNEQLVLVTHGWTENAFRTWVQNVLNAWVDRNSGTICAVDWSYLANYEYIIAATRFVYETAKLISNFITVMTPRMGITNDQVILIGHSLGGQISGMVGMHQKGTISKIFALDPAGPLFCMPRLIDIDRRLDPTDAKFVQVIMTSWGTLGCAAECGHQTFYPNNGIAPQGGCIAPIFQKGIAPEIIVCSHLQACQLFWWSLFPENDFTSNQCTEYGSYLAGLCKNTDRDQMGWYHKKTTGVYYLKTGSKPPSGTPFTASTSSSVVVPYFDIYDFVQKLVDPIKFNSI